MNKFLTLLTVLFIATQSFAQNNPVLKGILVDTTAKQSLKDASISILSKTDSTVEAFAIAKADGSFEVKGFTIGNYLVQISFNGYETQFKNVSFTKTNSSVDLGKVYLKFGGDDLAGVTVKASPVQIKGDTTEFNAGSFKTKPNATAEDLLKKLPGVQVDKDGQ